MSGLAKRAVSVITLGRMGFMAAYDVQMRYARVHLDELAGKPNAYGEDTLLLVEHTPVYTVGTRTKDYNVQEMETTLKGKGAEFYKSNRGGLITFHGPGQLVVYPILNLHHFKPSMKWYVCQLEKTLIQTLHKFGLKGRTTDQTGVWVEDRKIASIGLHGSRYVTTHGVSLNCNTDLEWFKHIVPCGLEGVDMTSLSRELKQDVPYQQAIKPFLRSFQDVFECELELKMLEEKELRDMSVTPRPHSEPKLDGGSGGMGLSQRAENQLRQMSTLSSSSSSSSPVSSSSDSDEAEEMENDRAKTVPMW